MQGATAGLRGRNMYRIAQVIEHDYGGVDCCDPSACHATEEQADVAAVPVL